MDDGKGQLPPAFHVMLWQDNPHLTANLRFLCAGAGISLEVVSTSAACWQAADALCSNGLNISDLVIVDCTNMATAYDRATVVVTRTACPVLICHPLKDFVDDLQALAHGPLIWLSPESTGLCFQDKLRRLKDTARTAIKEDDCSVPSPLTPRERQVQRLVAEKCSNHQIAERLGITPRTVKNHLANGKNKLGICNRQEFGASYRPSRGAQSSA